MIYLINGRTAIEILPMHIPHLRFTQGSVVSPETRHSLGAECATIELFMEQIIQLGCYSSPNSERFGVYDSS